MAYMDWTDDMDPPDTTYRSGGVHKNRDSAAKMKVDPMDRNGVTDSEKARSMAKQAAVSQSNQDSKAVTDRIGPNEPVMSAPARKNKDIAQELQKSGGKATQEAAARIDAGQYLPPTPGGGTQASYGDGEPAGGGGTNINVNMSYEGGEGGGGFSMGGGGEGSGGGMGGMQQAGAAQLGQDIAAMDDTRDQAHEAMFQDDTDIEAMQAIAEAQQGR